MNAINERIASLVTDAGKGVAERIAPLTEKYGFVKKKKNVAFTEHGAIARLNRKCTCFSSDCTNREH